MKKALIVITILFISIQAFGGKVELIKWGSDEGVRRLESSKYKVDFFPLANNFESQTNKIFCGPATAAIILNAFRVRNSSLKLPIDDSVMSKVDRKNLSAFFNPLFNRYTQNNIFKVRGKTKAQVLGEPMKVGQKTKKKKDFGFQLAHYAALFELHDIKVVKRSVTDSLSRKSIKKEMLSNLSTKNNYVIVNYARKSLGQKGGGHISPIGAYHKKSDSFLIMDVNPNKADWVWVKADDLITAMNTFDTVENRGYLLVSEGAR